MKIKATHLDFTTVYGAVRSIDQDELENGLPLSRLLSLSQFIEALVLFENITYELGLSDLWIRFSEMLKKSLLIRVIGDQQWLKPLDDQVYEK